MSKFHLTPSGQARQCSAKTPESCKYSQLAGETVEHYSTKEEAQQAYEQQQEMKQSYTKAVKKQKVVETISKEEQRQRADEYEVQTQKYNAILKHGGEKPSLEAVTLLRETTDKMVSLVEPMRGVSAKIEDVYIETLEEQHECLQNEKIALQKEYKKSNKANLGAFFSSKKKQEQENKITALEQAVKKNAESIEHLETKYNNFKDSVQRNRLKSLKNRGYSVISRYQGLNMSLHPQGPKMEYVCPSCNKINETRIYKNTSIKNTGYFVNCSSCREQAVLPITKINIQTLEE